MADPLTQTVEQFAPAPLNIFDQDQAETIISKYSGARRELEDATTAFEANRAVQQAEQDKYSIEQDRIRAERDKLLSTREDEEYNQRKEAEAMRGDLIADMYESLRPQEEGYDKRMVDFLGNAPPSIQNDPVFREVLTGYNRMADKAEDQRRQDREMEIRQKNTIEGIRERAKFNETMRNLTEEDWKNPPLTPDGQIDMVALGIKAARNQAANEINQLKEKERIKVLNQKELIEARNANAQLKAQAKQVEEVLINDKTAFPDRAAMVRQRYADNPATLDYGTGKAALGEAQAWDENKFDNEIIAARGYDNPEDYVNKITNLNVDQRDNRYRLWQHANTYGGKVPPRVSEGAAPAPAPAAPAPAPAAPAPAAPAPAAPAPAAPAEPANYGNRSDGTPKGKGWLGEFKLPNGKVATEYTAQSQSVKVNGEQIDFPTLVPSLTKDEVQLMVNDIIPNEKPVPDSVMQKAVDHARTRLEAGKSVFADTPAPAPVVAGQIPDVDAIVKATLSDPLLGQQVKNVETFDTPDPRGGVYSTTTSHDLGNDKLINIKRSPSGDFRIVNYFVDYDLSRLDGPASVEDELGKVTREYFIDGKKLSEEDYWKDPRVIEYAKTKGTAAPAPAAPKYTPEQLLKVAPAGSKIVTLPDGTLRIVTPEGKTLRPK